MDRFLPGRHPIDAFGNGGFRLGGVSHQGGLLIVPSGARALPVFEVQHLAALIEEKTEIDMLLIGMGPDIALLPKLVREFLKAENINYDLMSTNAAVRTYNVVLAEDRRVAAIMLAVDKAYA